MATDRQAAILELLPDCKKVLLAENVLRGRRKIVPLSKIKGGWSPPLC